MSVILNMFQTCVVANGFLFFSIKYSSQRVENKIVSKERQSKERKNLFLFLFIWIWIVRLEFSIYPNQVQLFFFSFTFTCFIQTKCPHEMVNFIDHKNWISRHKNHQIIHHQNPKWFLVSKKIRENQLHRHQIKFMVMVK